MGEPVLGRAVAGAVPFSSVRSPTLPGVSVARPEEVVASMLAAAERVDEVLASCAVLVVDAGCVAVVAGESSPEEDGGLDGEPSSVGGERSSVDGAGVDGEPSSVGGGDPPVAQAGAVTVLESNVTAPFRASSRPFTVALVVAMLEAKAMTVPTNLERTPSVDELPTCQKTLQAWAPLMRLTALSVAVMRVDAVWKMNTASGTCLASSVNVPVMVNDSGDL